MSLLYDAIVIGAGQAGLATAYHLRRAGLRFVVLDADRQPGGSWPQYYDSLTLFSPAGYSGLPGMPFPGDPGRYPTREEVVSYLREYARHFELPVIGGSRVEQVVREPTGFALHTATGEAYRSQTVVAASGSFSAPNLPRLPGQDSFNGTILHSATYHNPEPYAGKRVIVVGAGNSAVQIAVELAKVARVTLATRDPIRFVPQRILGCDLHCWLRYTGLDFVPWISDHSAGVVDTGKYRQAIAAGRPDRRDMFTGFTESGVTWLDGEEVIDVVIFATGFRPNFPYLAGLGVMDAKGRPRQRNGVGAVPGLYFVGLSGQRSLRSATLRGVGADAALVVRELRRHLTQCT